MKRLLILFIEFSFSASLFSQAGMLDVSFATTGVVTTTFSTLNAQALAVTVQPDGKILAGGYRYNSFVMSDFVLARYNSNGTFDNSFGTSGKVFTDFAGNDDGAHCIALQSDGKILLAGEALVGSFFRFAIARYNTNGTLDNSFGVSGKVTSTVTAGDAYIKSIAIQSDGKIVVAGYATNPGTAFITARYLSNGALDATFGTGGITSYVFGSGGLNEGRSVTLQADGKIVVAGGTTGFGADMFALIRYKTNGILDSTFDSDGVLASLVSGSLAQANGVALQGNKIVVVGKSFNGSDYDFALARFNSNGAIDSTFDSDGFQTTDFSFNGDECTSLIIQPDSKIICAGSSFINSSNPSWDFTLARYHPNGGIDSTFDADGKVNTDMLSQSYDGAAAVALQPDGKIVASGFASNAFTVARYLSGLTTSINEKHSELFAKVFPNPSTGLFRINLDKPVHDGILIVRNALGEIIVTEKVTGDDLALNLNHVHQGIYFVTLHQDNIQTLSEKVIIVH